MAAKERKVAPDGGIDSAGDDLARRKSSMAGFLGALALLIGALLALVGLPLSERLGIAPIWLYAAAATLCGLGSSALVAEYLRGAISFESLADIAKSAAIAAVPVFGATIGLGLSRGTSSLEIHFGQARPGESLEAPDVSRSTKSAETKEFDARLSAALFVFLQSKVRLTEQIAEIERRAAVSLIVGVGTTVGACVTFLILMKGVAPAVDSTWQSMLPIYLPKLGLVLMMEAFAFFFLRLYKATISEARAFHRDLNHLALQEAGLLAAWTGRADQHSAMGIALLAASGPSVDPAVQSNSVDPKAIAELATAIAKMTKG